MSELKDFIQSAKVEGRWVGLDEDSEFIDVNELNKFLGDRITMFEENQALRQQLAEKEIHRVKELEGLQAKIPQWISVDDELPEFHKGILFMTKDGVRLGRFYRKSHEFISNGDKFYKDEVSKWQELPEGS